MTRPLFFIGNKRSGTSLLVRLLNQHNGVFVSRESDIAWILYQIDRAGKFIKEFECYEGDSCQGMIATLQTHGDFIREQLEHNTIRDTFFNTQRRLARLGSPIQMKLDKHGALFIIGDKKPMQQCDPWMRDFMRTHFPDALYIHMIRHPYAVAFSMMAFPNGEDKPASWRDNLSGLLELWAKYELWAWDIDLHTRNEIEPASTFTVRLEEFAASPYNWLKRIFGFIGLDMPSCIAEDKLDALIKKDPNKKYQGLPVVKPPRNVARLMTQFGYNIDINKDNGEQ